VIAERDLIRAVDVEDARSARTTGSADLYLELLKKTLCGALHEEILYEVAPKRGAKHRLFGPLQRLLASRRLVLARSLEIGPETFSQSPPPYIPVAETLIGPEGLQHLRECIEDVLERGVSGDLIEAGVWRGGATVFMRAVLEANGDAARDVWAADSFAGMPTPSQTGYGDADDAYWAELDYLAVPLETVKKTFERYGLLDDRVRFLPGWFKDTLPTAPVEQLALIRLDADTYGSTMDALKALYPRLTRGGYVIVDDYWLPKCRAAVDDYRREHGVTEEITFVDRAIACWRRGVLSVTGLFGAGVEQADFMIACCGAAV
jgi:O-methyltransferase